MSDALLHVAVCTLRTSDEIPAALRCLRHLLPPQNSADRAVLLFCDLGDAPGKHMPEDAALIASLQSGVMAIDARSPGRFMLLIRRRAWDDAQRMYLGAGQKRSIRSVIADLLLTGRTDAVFDAATVSPASLKDAYGAVLFSPLSLACTPDVPARMYKALTHSPCGAAAARIVPPRTYPRSALARFAGVSLSPLAAWEKRRGVCPESDFQTPAIFAASSLRDTPKVLPPAPDCLFVRRESITLPTLLREYRAGCLRRPDTYALIAPAQLLLLFLCAFTGQGIFALLSFLPESSSLLSPHRLPESLVRLALLPVTASVSLDALLMRLFARSRLLRLRVPALWQCAWGCLITGGILLFAAVSGTHALPLLLPTSLLWLGAPLILPALDSPTSERLPLTHEQRAHLRALAEGSFSDALTDNKNSPPQRMLAACAGCMLGLIEPDEAARRTEALLTETMALTQNKKTAAEIAAELVSAQYLREKMGQCDAALRDLPGMLEAHALQGGLLPDGGRLCSFLLAARGGQSSSNISAQEEAPIDALFLPLGPAKSMPAHALTLPLTHPHTYLKRKAQGRSTDGTCRPADCFLALAAAALDHPFYPLLLRSPVVGPYAALLSL